MNLGAHSSKLILQPFFSILFVCAISSAQSTRQSIGSGAPGMKAYLAPSRSVVIYLDEPSTVGGGLVGGMSKRHIQVLFDPDRVFSQDAMDIPDQLYPLDANSAFSCTGGKWDSSSGHWIYEPRTFTVYSIDDGKLVMERDALPKTQARFHLSHEEVFLGRISDKVFFWKKYDPHRIYWRTDGSCIEYEIKLPKGVIDIYGVTRGIKKDFGAVVFRHSPGLFHYAPYTEDFVEFRLLDGEEVPHL